MMVTLAERYGQRPETVSRSILIMLAVLSGCGRGPEGEPQGSIHVDGSSTVYPITEAVVEEFLSEYRGVQVAVGVSGTGGGFKKFCAGEAEVADASRHLKESELARCEANGVDPVEFPIALDGLSVLVNPANDFVSCLTVGELREIWMPESVIESWQQVRPEWPDLKISLYGPGIDSGSFDYFTEHIVGAEDASRADYAASEDDNVLVHGISGDRGALGYFGHAYYVESADVLKLVAVDAGAGCVYPSLETIRSGEYKPLTRPLFVYADRAALGRPEVVGFVRFYFENVARLAAEVGYVPLAAERYSDLLAQLNLE